MSSFSTLTGSPRSLYLVIIYLVLLQNSLSSSQDLEENLYKNCSIPTSCGNLKNISYPFYVEDQQPSSCGYPGFKLRCIDSTTPVLNISGDNYTIQHIYYQNQSIQLTNSAFLDTECTSIASVHNLTLDNGSGGGGVGFTLAYNYSRVTLLANCNKQNKSVPQGQVVYNLPCKENGNSKDPIWAVHEQDARFVIRDDECETVVSVPYEGEENDDVEDVLKRGIFLNWTAENCGSCQMSGGRCGYNKNVSQFVCYCRDQVHLVECHPTHPHRKFPLKIILATAVIPGGILIVMVVALVVFLCCAKRGLSSRQPLSKTESNLEEQRLGFGVSLFSYRELEEATNNFEPTRVLGKGGFGAVYHGKLKDRREVAVKRLYEKNYKVEQFMNEVEILTRLRHQNLVTLYGCTSRHSRELLLVYEYIPNGTVADHLHGDRAKPGSLSWPVRMSIAIETASALSYLHASDIIHRDVKTCNLLLDNNFTVKVADFGISRLFPSDVTHISTAPQGTPGYLDPEYYQCFQLTDRSDVYSFGVVLLELISSLPAVDMNRHRQEINLVHCAMRRIQRCAFSELVDPNLGYDSDYKVRRMTALVGKLAFQCLQHEKEFRPPMNEVLEALKRIESTDYEALEAEEKDKNDQASNSTKTIPSQHCTW
ncbi:hypothetical protein Dimus_031119 [Dionaea muscipula]